MAPLQFVSRLLTGMFALLVLLVLPACGGGSDSTGTPGSSGDTGVNITATLVGRYANANFYSVDVVRQICDPGPPPEVEIFTDHQAKLTVLASLQNPNNTTPGILYVEKYTITFLRESDSIGAPPILTDVRHEVIAIVPPTGTGTSTTTADILLVDLIRKDKYRTDILSGIYSSSAFMLNNYTAQYTFEGKNQYGEEFKFQTQMAFAIGSFDYCDV